MSNALGVVKASVHAIAPECVDELDALIAAARALDQAEDNLESAWLNWGGANASTVGTTIGAVACIAAAETVIVPILCAVGGVFGVGGTTMWGLGSAKSIEAAEEAIDDLNDVVDGAANKFCNCMHNHKP